MCTINVLNGFVSIEQFGRTSLTLSVATELTGDEGERLIESAVRDASGVRVAYDTALPAKPQPLTITKTD